MSKTIYQINEYGSFITGRQIEGYTTLPPTIFEQLENFILSSKNVSSTHTFHKFFGTSSDTNALLTTDYDWLLKRYSMEKNFIQKRNRQDYNCQKLYRCYYIR